MAYRGKFPNRIKAVMAVTSGHGVMVQLNSGSVWHVSGGAMPKVGQSLDDVLSGTSAQAVLVQAGAGDCEAVYTLATAAADTAGLAKNASMPPENMRGLDCGFASAVVRPATGAFVAWCRKNGKGSRHWSSGWEFSMSQICSARTQSIDVYVAAARAFIEVLARAGIRAEIESRLD